MATPIPVFKSAFVSPEDEFSGTGKRPVVFDILAPDFETSLLPDGLKLVLHVNPKSMQFSYSKIIERMQTKGGFVEQHFGEGADTISFEFATGGFMRLHTGLISTTGGGVDIGGTRRDTIAYDTYLDLLGIFKCNGSIFDGNGNIVFQGIIKCSFDGDYWLGWFGPSFSLSEDAESPYQFTLTTDFVVAKEFMTLRSLQRRPDTVSGTSDLAARELVDTLRERQETSTNDFEEGNQSSGGWFAR